VQAAATAFERRFRQTADVCYVNPVDLPPETGLPQQVVVIPEPTVLRHHFIVGHQGRHG
jgi:hypothetical protein